MAYFVFVMSAVSMGAHLGPYGEKYPYFFLDVDVLGLPRVILTGLIMEVCFFVLGLLWVGIDKCLSKMALKA